MNFQFNSIYLSSVKIERSFVIITTVIGYDLVILGNVMILLQKLFIRLGWNVRNYTHKISSIVLMLGFVGAPWMVSNALADDKIRLNPAYIAPAEQNSALFGDGVISENLEDDFNQFLNPHEESDQYIFVSEPEDGQRPIISLNSDGENSVPILQINQRYQYTPSLSFNLPSSFSALGVGSNAGLYPSSLGGSQLVFSLARPYDDSNPLRRHDSLELMLGSSFINGPINRYTALLDRGIISPKAYNLSFGLGYSGFQLDGSFSRNDLLFSADMTGFDLGFGYNSANWSANVRVGEYSSSRPLLLSKEYNIFDNVSAYELGAAYRLFANVNLTGRFTYYSYGFGNDLAPIDDVKSLIFGTNLSF